MDRQKSFYVFLFGCIVTRLLLAYLAWYLANEKKWNLLAIMGCIFLLPGIIMWFLYATNSRTTGPEAPDGKIWWNWARPIHATLYLAFGYYAINADPCAWKILLLDTLLGLSFFAASRMNEPIVLSCPSLTEPLLPQETGP